ncbi:class I SAM-dependent methyltransferase [Coralloluteibacterium stylophorae]|uniref:Class I SAM-dependent methyltransferase n=1 Tax=Coralloluteibacterium stylophorae TaxID=1776034 RepID=A0A8J7VTC7_9GAMM|nr:class I SAM-dependent methyltransferase [Coralloluteibacterium stylophorae]MBS7456480.1 class I SAM-dependent methyltransferase [Coralloluteibacterium stylophorae]
MTKIYDQAYFDRWYRQRGIGAGALAHKVAAAVAVAEYHLGRPLRSVLDVGCGEGAWLAPLRRLRPRVAYLGLDPSEYAVARYGRSRNLRPARFGDMAALRPGPPVDLLVCSDVMHYVADAELRRGLSGFGELCHGVAFLEVYGEDDAIDGDMDGFIRRPARFYRRAFERAGFAFCGPHCWLSPARREDAARLETA